MKFFLTTIITTIIAISICFGNSCPDTIQTLDVISSPDGNEYRLYTNGKIFIKDTSGNCTFYQQYFDPDFTAKYVFSGNQLYFKISENELFRIRNSITDSFSHGSHLRDCIAKSMADSNLNWFTAILQSPLAKTIPEYVALRTCIFNATCDFKDNRIDFAPDPLDSTNKCMKFTAFAPTSDMITSKSSIENTALYFVENDTVQFEAKYFIKTGMPTTLVDFENQWFEGSPGMRILVSGGKLSIEMKYGQKPVYRQRPGKEISLPVGRWFHVKLRMAYRYDNTAPIKLWQDGQLIIDTIGRTLPTTNSIPTNLEVGISATSVFTEMFLDNVQLRRLQPASASTENRSTYDHVKQVKLLSPSGSSHIKIGYTIPNGSDYSFADISGRIILKGNITGNGTLNVDFTKYPAGIYFFKVKSQQKVSALRFAIY
ncbi:MAG: T9SS type A sorting domain-containing protein [Fibrobacteres bacterium]|nr:T9SS type A sorting domain-containing protein [Fibrobacterota bacterium]